VNLVSPWPSDRAQSTIFRPFSSYGVRSWSPSLLRVNLLTLVGGLSTGKITRIVILSARVVTCASTH